MSPRPIPGTSLAEISADFSSLADAAAKTGAAFDELGKAMGGLMISGAGACFHSPPAASSGTVQINVRDEITDNLEAVAAEITRAMQKRATQLAEAKKPTEPGDRQIDLDG